MYERSSGPQLLHKHVQLKVLHTAAMLLYTFPDLDTLSSFCLFEKSNSAAVTTEVYVKFLIDLSYS